MSTLESIFSLSYLAAVLTATIPFLLLALGGAITERSGIVDLALEAKYLWGAFAAAIFSYETGSVVVGIAAAMAAGAMVAAVQALWTIKLKADQVVTGIALNLAAAGLTRYLLQVLYHRASNSPDCPGVSTVIYKNPIFYLTILATAVVIVMIGRTRLGLRVRAVGERPDAVAAAGVDVARTRWVAVLIGGAVAGLAGAQLSLPVAGFSADSSVGRGYVALAAVIMGGWRPAVVALVCLGLGASEALGQAIEAGGVAVPTELLKQLPYVLALVLLALHVGRGRVPSALGRTS